MKIRCGKLNVSRVHHVLRSHTGEISHQTWNIEPTSSPFFPIFFSLSKSWEIPSFERTNSPGGTSLHERKYTARSFNKLISPFSLPSRKSIKVQSLSLVKLERLMGNSKKSKGARNKLDACKILVPLFLFLNNFRLTTRFNSSSMQRKDAANLIESKKSPLVIN